MGAPVFRRPFCYGMGSENSVAQMRLYARFNLAFLYNEGLVDTAGRGIGLAGLVAFNFLTEPGNLALNRLFRSRKLHAYLAEQNAAVKKEDKSTWLSTKLCGILAYLFFPRFVMSASSAPKTDKPVDPAEEAEMMPAWRKRRKHKPSEGCPGLPPVPPSIKEELESYNKDVLDTYLNWVHVMSTRTPYSVEANDFTLPFTARELPHDLKSQTFPKGIANPKGKFMTWLHSTNNSAQARNLFSCLQGRMGDTFMSADDAVKNTRRGVLRMDEKVLPVVESGENATNSYLLDFCMHGKLSVLAADNGISATDAYRLVKDFQDALEMVLHALEKIVPRSRFKVSGEKATKEETRQIDVVCQTTRELISLLTRNLALNKA